MVGCVVRTSCTGKTSIEMEEDEGLVVEWVVGVTGWEIETI